MRYRARTVIGRRMQSDRRFRIVISAAAMLGINLLYGAGHAVFALVDGSAWLLVMAVYYILLGVMRFGAVLTERKRSSEQFVMRFCGGILMVLALPALALCLIFAGGLALLIPLGLVCIALGILKTCV